MRASAVACAIVLPVLVLACATTPSIGTDQATVLESASSTEVVREGKTAYPLALWYIPPQNEQGDVGLALDDPMTILWAAPLDAPWPWARHQPLAIVGAVKTDPRTTTNPSRLRAAEIVTFVGLLPRGTYAANGTTGEYLDMKFATYFIAGRKVHVPLGSIER